MKRFPGKLVFALAAVVAAAIAAGAQKSEPVKQMKMPPSTPMMTPADVAAKVPTPRPDDVKSLDAIINAAYEAISGPAGTRDWNRFRSIFLPQARFTEVGRGTTGGRSSFPGAWKISSATQAQFSPRKLSTRTA